MDFRSNSGLMVFMFFVLCCSAPCFGQSPQQTPALVAERPATEQSATEQPAADPKVSGSISGTVLDQSGAILAGARVSPYQELAKINLPMPSRPGEKSSSGEDGQFFFASVAPGPFLLTVTAAGFATQTSSGTLHPGEFYLVPRIALAIAANVTDVQVNLTRIQVAQEQVRDEEKQRVFGFIPNFYVTYDPHPLPLNMRQKYNLAWKTTIDPFTFAMVGAIAGVQQAE